MLRRNMVGQTFPLSVGLEVLLGDLRSARGNGDLGRLALLTYCEVRRWARLANESALARFSSEVMAQTPHGTRAEFLAQIDQIIGELELARARHARLPVVSSALV